MTKRKRRRKRRSKLSSQGVLLILMVGAAVLLIAGVCLARGLLSVDEGAAAEAAAGGAPGDTPAAERTPEATSTVAPSPTPEKAASGSRLPTDDEAANAVEGIIRTSNVVLRKGPGKNYGVIRKYDVGEYLLVYAHESEYSLVQMMSDGNYGFLSTDFITQFGILPDEAPATPMPAVPQGVVMGIVNVKELKLRSVPSQDKNTPIGLCHEGDLLWVTLQSGEFYYVEVAATGEKGYVFAEYVMVQAPPPVV